MRLHILRRLKYHAVMTTISPEARALQLDVSDAPHQWHLITLDADGELIDLLEHFTNSDEAHAAAERLARECGLPYSLCHTPHG